MAESSKMHPPSTQGLADTALVAIARSPLNPSPNVLQGREERAEQESALLTKAYTQPQSRVLIANPMLRYMITTMSLGSSRRTISADV